MLWSSPQTRFSYSTLKIKCCTHDAAKCPCPLLLRSFCFCKKRAGPCLCACKQINVLLVAGNGIERARKGGEEEF
ncbi:hypothetical protein EDC90_10155 [Martelella mediterranea]|uniref:Uncharacterized protein n=1 Tax=Martelella mediterranea TaxID=293089 RepID=A0A4R3NS22_9HYPH|nr:hypothetical protein EDC90_10155 [Martelella mediterranea]